MDSTEDWKTDEGGDGNWNDIKLTNFSFLPRLLHWQGAG